MKKLCIIGTGGFAREVASYLIDGEIKNDYEIECFLDIEEREDVMGIKVMPMSFFDSNLYEACVAIGSSSIRKRMINELPKNTTHANIIHKNSYFGKRVRIGNGVIVCPFSVVTVDVNLGNLCILNYNVTVGHDTKIGDYFTASPGVNVSGNCEIGDIVYLGTNSSVREKTTIASNVTVGANSCVVKNILASGTYVGVPAKLLVK